MRPVVVKKLQFFIGTKFDVYIRKKINNYIKGIYC